MKDRGFRPPGVSFCPDRLIPLLSRNPVIVSNHNQSTYGMGMPHDIARQ